MERPGANTAARLFLCGDVMLGRGIDQLLPHPCNPALREDYVRDARDYVELAEEEHGPIERPVAPPYVWGDALRALDAAAPDARLINLETSVTTSEHFWPGKGIHYRIHPENVAAVTCARIDACALANNHVLDFGREGLLETLSSLKEAGVQTSGAGRDSTEAQRPARIALRRGGTVLFFSVGSEDSGVFPDWAAAEDRPGVELLPNLSAQTAERVAARVRSHREPGDLAIVSIHWGSNWGYRVPAEQVLFAHQLIDGGVDLVHGHSSHHPRPIEVYRGKLILYGCGDFISDYEGIGGYEEFRSDLRVMYLPTLDAADGKLLELRLVPFQTWRLSLRRASAEDGQWLAVSLSRASEAFGTRVVASDGELLLRSLR